MNIITFSRVAQALKPNWSAEPIQLFFDTVDRHIPEAKYAETIDGRLIIQGSRRDHRPSYPIIRGIAYKLLKTHGDGNVYLRLKSSRSTAKSPSSILNSRIDDPPRRLIPKTPQNRCSDAYISRVWRGSVHDQLVSGCYYATLRGLDTTPFMHEADRHGKYAWSEIERCERDAVRAANERWQQCRQEASRLALPEHLQELYALGLTYARKGQCWAAQGTLADGLAQVLDKRPSQPTVSRWKDELVKLGLWTIAGWKDVGSMRKQWGGHWVTLIKRTLCFGIVSVSNAFRIMNTNAKSNVSQPACACARDGLCCLHRSNHILEASNEYPSQQSGHAQRQGRRDPGAAACQEQHQRREHRGAVGCADHRCSDQRHRCSARRPRGV